MSWQLKSTFDVEQVYYRLLAQRILDANAWNMENIFQIWSVVHDGTRIIIISIFIFILRFENFRMDNNYDHYVYNMVGPALPIIYHSAPSFCSRYDYSIFAILAITYFLIMQITSNIKRRTSMFCENNSAHNSQLTSTRIGLALLDLQHYWVLSMFPLWRIAIYVKFILMKIKWKAVVGADDSHQTHQIVNWTTEFLEFSLQENSIGISSQICSGIELSRIPQR